MTLSSVIRHPLAFGPLLMSLSALLIVAVRIMLTGTAPGPDEGTAAHLWQLLMALQLPLIPWFLIAWLPRAPRQVMTVFGLQMIMALAALAPIIFLGW